MNVSYEWLKELVDVSVSPEELMDKVSRTGIEVDSVTRLGEGLKKVVVGKVASLRDHPDSDHLKIAMVDTGDDELRQIVCGAPNIEAGQTVVVALPGARIGGNEKIKRGKMRGVVSDGMICALQELGFSDAIAPKSFDAGIYVFDEPLTPGSDALAALGMDDAVLDFEITPNRADALGMRGVAWEVGATYGNKPHFTDQPVTETGKPVSDYLTATVADPTDAPAYQMRVVDNITIKDSPLWLQRRLWNAGVRPINNIVDVTNLIMLGYGQPLHAFDYAKLGSQEILVRRAKAGEALTTLDGNDHELDPDDIVITNGQQPVALAGVMGGLNSEITATTTTVVIESAMFAPTNIRKTALKYNLRSQASSRFEKGVDVGSINLALDEAARLMAELGDGTVATGTLSATAVKPEPTVVDISLDRINHVLGTSLDAATVTGIFEQLGFGVTEADGLFAVAVPTRRWDIHIEADLIEEVARIYGYDNLPNTLPTTTMTIGAFTPQQARLRRTRRLLEGLGLTQAITYSLVSDEQAGWFELTPSEQTAVAFPMTTDHSALRRNLLAGLIDAVQYNLARKQTDIALYEQGRVFPRSAGHSRPEENEYVAGVLTGNLLSKTWHQAAQAVDFYAVKGIVAHLLADFRLATPVQYLPLTTDAHLHPGQSAKLMLGGETIGLIGRLHPAFEQAEGLPATYVFELNLSALMKTDRAEVLAQPAPKFPAVTRDIAIQVAKTVDNATIEATIRAAGGKYLQSITLFDVYEGAHIAPGQKSLAYTLTYLNEAATLTDEQVTTAFDKVVAALQEHVGASIR
ncbi:phenylalanine--tRNA ligase subunit beta [Lacticaseibacillus nasuensis]|uniref:Phenylalanine--tRNA ligase beta subunit n=1 Tax=Lacticaseibacillus nasuensis JCM 17158 TaxID=1291734 RepID=A0A0R1JPY2_9LACO|nr:phenylalanine--tRNA ligase subunit beta [Lacticaseibacillus nasuensis]KRK73208.1 Phenylalanyl-tRNA synthetase beta chain (phenylalanine--tRNA ligase beta chain) (PheRS) [Lacticaseibacillus nasuensis JCM 17158]